MEWYNILTIVIGAFGGVTGIIALYNAKPNRTKIEVEVLDKVITRLDKELAAKDEDFKEYKHQVNTRVEEVKKEVLAEREENAKFRIAIYQAYRCKYPADVHRDCPVIAELERDPDVCANCEHVTGHA